MHAENHECHLNIMWDWNGSLGTNRNFAINSRNQECKICYEVCSSLSDFTTQKYTGDHGLSTFFYGETPDTNAVLNGKRIMRKLSGRDRAMSRETLGICRMQAVRYASVWRRTECYSAEWIIKGTGQNNTSATLFVLDEGYHVLRIIKGSWGW